MAFAKINKSGCCERHGNVQVRVDFYLDPTDPRYNDTYIDIPVLDKEGEPTGKVYKQLSPFHSHFMYFSPDVTEAEILKEAEYHLPNFYTAFQNQWDKSDGGMRHGWATEKRIRPIRKDETFKASDYEAIRLSCEAKIAELSEATTKVINLEGKEYPATEIDVGGAAIDRGSYVSTANNTYLTLDNPANNTGVLDTIEIWANTTMTDTKVGTFLGSGSSWTNRDYEVIGTVTQGAKRTFTGLSINVATGDVLGTYYTGGRIERDNSGYAGIISNRGDEFGTGEQSYSTSDEDGIMSLYGTGETLILPTVTTSSVSNITHNSAQSNGNITATGGENCDERGFVYGTTSKSAPGNVAPTSSGYDDYENETGTYSTGTYNLTLTSLTENQTYYVRAYAHNSAGYAYGDEVSFRTAKAYNVSITTNLSLSPSVTFTKGKGVAITTGLGLCVNDRNNYLITIPSTVTRDVVDFPFVITENNIPSSFWDEAETDNLILRDVTGDLLYGELVTLDTVNKKLELYVKIPYAFEGISRSFYLYCGDGDSLVGLTGTANAQNVWDDNFVAIYHMNDNPLDSTQILDSTSNANHGTKGVGTAAPTEVDGLVGKAQSFDGGDTLLVSSLVTEGAEITVETLLATTFTSVRNYAYSWKDIDGYNAPAYLAVPFSSTRNAIVADNDTLIYSYYDLLADVNEYTDGNYHNMVYTLNTGLAAPIPVYGDGVLDVGATQGLQNGFAGADLGGDLQLGYKGFAYGVLQISETRISNTARDGGWIGFTSSNLKSNSSSYSVSTTTSTSPSRLANYSRDVLANLTLTSLVTRTVNYAVRHIVTNLSMTPIVTRAVGYTITISTSLSLTSIVSAIKRGWVKVKLKLFKRSVNMYMNNRNVKVKLHKRDVNLKIRRK